MTITHHHWAKKDSNLKFFIYFIFIFYVKFLITIDFTAKLKLNIQFLKNK